jgi:glycosyltransferase involved in cell wall biosynthesis
MSSSLIYWFKTFLDKVGQDKAILLMHTDPKDINGPDLEAIVADLELNNGQVLFSTNKLTSQDMAALYNMADCTINISDAEGFGLGTLESLSCGTPIIVNMTGGLQEQVTDGNEWFGIPIYPASRPIIGSQSVPFIYEDVINEASFVDALEKIYYLTKEERKEMGLKGREHVLKNYSFKKYQTRWVEIIEEVHKSHSSWSNKSKGQRFRVEEV